MNERERGELVWQLQTAAGFTPVQAAAAVKAAESHGLMSRCEVVAMLCMMIKLTGARTGPGAADKFAAITDCPGASFGVPSSIPPMLPPKQITQPTANLTADQAALVQQVQNILFPAFPDPSVRNMITQVTVTAVRGGTTPDGHTFPPATSLCGPGYSMLQAASDAQKLALEHKRELLPGSLELMAHALYLLQTACAPTAAKLLPKPVAPFTAGDDVVLTAEQATLLKQAQDFLRSAGSDAASQKDITRLLITAIKGGYVLPDGTKLAPVVSLTGPGYSFLEVAKLVQPILAAAPAQTSKVLAAQNLLQQSIDRLTVLQSSASGGSLSLVLGLVVVGGLAWYATSKS